MIVGKDPYAGHYRFGGILSLVVVPIAGLMLVYHLHEMPLLLQVAVMIIVATMEGSVAFSFLCLFDRKLFVADTIIEVREENNKTIIKGIFSEFAYTPSMLVKMHPETLGKGERAIVNLTIRLDGRRRFLTLSPKFENFEEVFSLLKNTSKESSS